MPTFHTSTQRVLIVDDDAFMCDILAAVLGSDSREIGFATSGDAALELLRTVAEQDAPAVVLTDLHMPGLSGPTLARRLRTAIPSSSLLLAMSATKPSESAAAAFDAFLQKPFNASDFDTAVQQARDARSRAVIPKASVAPVLDESTYDTLVAIMPPSQVDSLYTMCLDDVVRRTASMAGAAASGDRVAFVHGAHAIKGSCGMLGLSEVHRLATRMEAEGLGSTFLLNDLSLAMERVRRMLDERR